MPYVQSATKRRNKSPRSSVSCSPPRHLRASALRLEPVNLLQIAEKAVQAERREPGGLSIPDELRVAGDAELLTRALANVIRNAIQHAGNNGPITMEAAEQPGDVTIVVSDSGPGVPE